MTDLIAQWLDDRVPGVDPVDLDRYGVTFQAAQMIGGVRQGRDGWVLPVYVDPPSCWHIVDDPILEDFVIFDPAEPSKWRTKYGQATMLGEEAAREARLGGTPLPVYRTPLAWLHAAGTGVVVLNPLAFGVAMLGDSRLRLVPEDVEHGEEMDRILDRATRVGRPSIWVRRAA